MTFQRHPLLRQLYARPRLFISGAVGLLAVLLMPAVGTIRLSTQLLIGWNVGVWLYIILMVIMMKRSSHQSIHRRAHAQAEGQTLILTLVTIAACASLIAIVAELVVVKDLKGFLRSAHIGLAALTIVASWTFIHLIFALHYAHDYFVARARGESGGLEFPGTDCPSYADFVYFAAVIGTSGQTADVSFTSSAMRSVGAVHCVLAFLFNTTLLALTINIAAGLF